MKRTFVLLLLLAVTLAGCGGQAPEPSPTPAPTEALPPAPTAVPTEQAPPPTLTPQPTVEPTAWPAVSSITITTPDGVELAGALYLPSHRPAPGVLLLHMLGRQKEDWEELALRLQAEGYAVLAMDLRGHGASGGEVDWAAAVGDLGLAWATLSGHTDVDGDRTAILGASIGANLALVTAANTSRVVTVVLLSPGLDYRGVKTEEAMATYGTRSVLIVASEEDTYAAESSRVLDGLAQGEHRLVMYQGAGHGTQMFDPQPELADEIVSWLDTYLRE